MKTRNTNMTYSPASIILNVFSRVVNASNSVSPPIRSTATFVRIVKKNNKITTPNTFNTIPPIFSVLNIICYSYSIYPVFNDTLSKRGLHCFICRFHATQGPISHIKESKVCSTLAGVGMPVCSIV